MIQSWSVRLQIVTVVLASGLPGLLSAAQAPTSPPAPASAQQAEPPAVTPSVDPDREKARQQLKNQEHQRVLGILPNFNTSYLSDALPLSPGQKFHLAFKSATDPVQFGIAAMDAALTQWDDGFPGYNQGAAGYGKRFGAAYVDAFDGAMLGGAVFPVLLHQDPRYFRRGKGSVKRRLLYAIATTVICKSDSGKWEPNYSNVLGSLAAGGIANLYYPASDRGAELTVQRAFTVTAEGALGAIFAEFWPDISDRVARRHKGGQAP